MMTSLILATTRPKLSLSFPAPRKIVEALDNWTAREGPGDEAG